MASHEQTREAALHLLNEITKKNVRVDQTLNRFFHDHELATTEKAHITELVNGTVRWQGKIDWILKQFLSRKQKRLPVMIRQILAVAIYQIFENPDVPAALVVNESVSLAKKYGHTGTKNLTNGVLRNIVRQKNTIRYPDLTQNPVQHIAVCYSHPEWLIERWLTFFSIETVIAFCQANNQRPDVFLRVNRLKTSVQALQNSLQVEGIDTVFMPPLDHDFVKITGSAAFTTTAAFKAGHFQPQDLSAGLVVQLVDPQPNTSILDVCAAPGGKTTFLAERLNNTANIVAGDLNQKKLVKLQTNLDRLGITCVQLVRADGRALPFGQQFDQILLDVPCSGSGVLARRSDARWQRKPEDFATLTRWQQQLIRAAANHLQPGGTLIYSTCSIDPAENMQIVEAFLADHPNFELEPAAEKLPSQFVKNGYLQTFPHEHHMDGAFGARLRKRT